MKFRRLFFRASDNILEPLILLLTRFYMFDVFYSSGKSKLDNYLNDNWDTTVQLFRDIHPVPYLPTEIAAIAGTASEVILSCLLLIGLLGRFAALGLLGVTAVIELSFIFQDPDYTTFDGHIMWALLLSFIVIRGSGTISLDTLVSGRFAPSKNY